jgi:hypothetical protein
MMLLEVVRGEDVCSSGMDSQRCPLSSVTDNAHITVQLQMLIPN